MAGKTWLNCLKHKDSKDHTQKWNSRKEPDHKAIGEDPHCHRSEPEGSIDHEDDIAITEDLIDPEYILDPPEKWRLDINATSAKELESNRHCIGTEKGDITPKQKEEEKNFEGVILPPNKMSVAVQVVNGREQGTEEEEMPEAGGGVQEEGGGAKDEEGRAQAMETREEGGAQAMETREEEEPVPCNLAVMSDSELDQSGAPKKKKFKPWKSIKKIFKKRSSKGSEGDTPNKSKSKSTSELDMGAGELNKRISMSEDSVFTPDKTTSPKDRSSYSLNTNLADEINAKLKERASSSDDGYAQSSEDAMTTGDTTHDNSYIAPSDSSKTDSGIITTEDEKSFTSVGVKDNQHVTVDMKRLKKENPGDVDLDLIHTPKLLSSSAARHRISVAPSNRRPSRKARTPQKRSSSRLDEAHSPIAEEPSTPTKSPAPLELNDSELPFPGVALSSSPTQQPSIGMASKPKSKMGFGPMVLPPIPSLFGPKGSKAKTVGSTPDNDFLSQSANLPSESVIFPTNGENGDRNNRVDLKENQKNGKANDKHRHEDVEKLLDVDPTLFSDEVKSVENDSTINGKGMEGNGKIEFDFVADPLGLMEDDTFGGPVIGGVGDGLGIADLDLLVDLPDPLDLGKNMFGVETILEEDEDQEEEEAEEVEVNEMEASDDFIEDESSMESLEEEKDGVKLGSAATMVNVVKEDIGKSPPAERKEISQEAALERMDEEKAEEEEERYSKRDEDTKINNNEESRCSGEEVIAQEASTVFPVMTDCVVTETNVTPNDDDNDNDDVNDSNYPGINGTPHHEDTLVVSAELTGKDEVKKDTPKKDELPIVIIDLPPPEDSKTAKDSTQDGTSQGEEEEEEEEEPMVLPQVPKEVIIIMKDDPAKKESEEVKPTTPTTPNAPSTPVEQASPEEETTDAVPASPPPPPQEIKKDQEVEKESSEMEKDKEEGEKKEDDVEERRLSVAASKALFEAKIPEPTKSSSNKVNGTSAPKFETRRSSQPEPEPETKAEADTKLSEKEKVEEKKEDAEEPVFSDQDNNKESQENKEEPISLRDRISKYQNLATKTSVKGLTAHTGTRSSPTKLRPASTSNIENKDSSNKFASKVPSKPSSTNSSKPSESMETTIAPSSKPSTNHPSLSSSSSISSSTPRKPLQPKSLQPQTDHHMVSEKSVNPNEMSKFERVSVKSRINVMESSCGTGSAMLQAARHSLKKSSTQGEPYQLIDKKD